MYMAVPRLSSLKCFLEVQVLPNIAAKASTIKGAFVYGTPIHPREIKQIDLIVSGSVAVNSSGERIGKGGGYPDVEFALACEFNLIDKITPIISTVHDLQILKESFPHLIYDIPLDFIFSPSQTLKCQSKQRRPVGIYWDLIKSEKLKQIPILQEIKEKGSY